MFTTKSLFSELPYNKINIICAHGQFSNSLNSSIPSKRYLEKLTSIHDLDIFSLNDKNNANTDPDSNYLFRNVRCKYFSPYTFVKNFKQGKNYAFPFFHINISSLQKNLDNFQNHLLSELCYHFDIIGVTETRITNEVLLFNPSLLGYNFEFVPTPLSAGGVGMYINDSL